MIVPFDVESTLAAGLSALEGERFTEAADAFARVQQEMPQEIAVALMVANAWHLSGDAVAEREALLHTYRASIDDADDASVYQLGAALLDAGAPTEARRCFERVVRHRPKDPAALGALAGATRAEGDPHKAWPIMQRAMALTSKQPALLLTAAQIRHALGDLTRARYWLDRAEAIRPEHSPTRLQRALTSLLGGPTAAGWADFEHRGLPTPPSTGASPWHGEPLTGQTILVTSEQGQGDNFQFIRFVSNLVARGAKRVVVECHPGALSLFIASGFDAVPKGQAPVTDWYVPMLSLPYRLDIGADIAGARVPYLHAGVRLAPNSAGQRRLGLVWQGNPAFLATTLRDFDQTLLPQLLSLPEIEWVSLQYGATYTADHHRLKKPEMLSNWLDTARMLASLDGVVTVDTGIAHLAGGMGIPTFILLPFTPDWRWSLGTETTLWYPSARLIRQRAPRDWASTIAPLLAALHSAFA
ncbi:tetratricopeptide repeat protein [Gemmatimonas sp.]|uniref:tetratricopeptide repeat protein n=1 Tax=Gemmatimonas sp. TaxID=1962908 RepID=UPI0035688B04